MTDTPSVLDICEEVLGIFTGLVTVLLPFLLLSAPAIIPLALFTGIVLGALGLVMVVLAAPVVVLVLLVRLVTRRGSEG